MAPRDEDEPEYRVYRSRGRSARRARADADKRSPRAEIDDLRQEVPRPEYTVHGRRRAPGRGLRGARTGRRALRIPGVGLAGPITAGWVIRRVLLALLAWILLSLVLFLVSAQIEQGQVDARAGSALASSGFPLTSPTTILVLGSDARSKRSKEKGATKIGSPSRSDTILLMRIGAGHSARLSIPRDTVVAIPGHGSSKINAAYALGGAALAIRTVDDYLGVRVNHVIEVNFDNFPALVDSLGGIDVRTSCVVSRINGGYRNGGITLHLRAGMHHLDGKRALALARTRKNSCRKHENDLSRARRQQNILAAMKSSVLSPGTFLRLPLVSWNAPRAIRTDMGGPTLLGVFAALATSSTPKTHVLGHLLPGGGVGVSSAEEKRTVVSRFLNG